MAKIKTKMWWESKTVWFNIVALVLELTTVISNSPLLSDKQSALAFLASVQTVGNVVLRFVSDQPLTRSIK